MTLLLTLTPVLLESPSLSLAEAPGKAAAVSLGKLDTRLAKPKVVVDGLSATVTIRATLASKQACDLMILNPDGETLVRKKRVKISGGKGTVNFKSLAPGIFNAYTMLTLGKKKTHSRAQLFTVANIIAPTATPADTNTPVATSTATATQTAVATATNTSTPTITPSPTGTATNTPTPTATATNTATPTATSTFTPSPTPTATNIPYSADPYLFWTESASNGTQTIQRAKASDGSDRRTLITRSNPIFGLAFDRINGKVYWSESGHIFRTNLNGSAVETVVAASSAYGMALDDYNQRLYYQDNVGEFRYITLTGSVTRLLSYLNESAFNLVFDAGARTFYMSAVGHVYRIQANATGGTSLDFGLSGYAGLALDAGNSLLFYTDVAGNGIYRAATDTSNQNVLLQTGLMSPYAVAIDASSMYVADTDNSRIVKADRSGSNAVTLISSVDQPLSLIYAASVTPAPSSSTNCAFTTCYNGGTCIGDPDGGHCVCACGYVGATCQSIDTDLGSCGS